MAQVAKALAAEAAHARAQQALQEEINRLRILYYLFLIRSR